MPTRIDLPRPPADPEPAPFPLLASLAPVLGAGAMWLLLQTPTVLVFAILGPVIAVASMGDGRRNRKRRRAREAARWRAEIAEVANRIDTALDEQRAELAAAHPGPRAVAARPSHDPHRWRREPGAAVPVVLGTGPLASGIAVEGEVPATEPAVRRLGAAEQAERLRSAAAVVEGPLVVDAREGIGIVGPPLIALALARSAVVQAADAVPPDAAEAIVPADPAWDWLAQLPHPIHREPGSSVRLVGDGVEVTIAVAEHASQLPRECRIVVHASLDAARVGERTCTPAAIAEREALAAVETLAAAAAHAGIRLAGGLPAHVELETLPVAEGGLAAVFLADEAPIELDLVRDGPHAVVGGTTGSGKSELLIAWVAAMAAGRSTAEVSFLLVDFKGGASFAPLLGLAHCVGVMTDLDQAGAVRAIESLKAELRRRERLLAEQGARSIEEAVGMPRLVIVVDEFAAMLAELPDLHRLFVDLAARGRSLGVHLVLCTQRPAEAVRDSLLANCGIRISLRVTDEHDAVAVTGDASAASIPLAARGRCVVRVSGGATRTAQAALAGPAHLAALVAAAAEQPRAPRPWREPLPASLPLAAVDAAIRAAAAGRVGTGGQSDAVRSDAVRSDAVRSDAARTDTAPAGIRLGLVDRPAEQLVAPVLWRPRTDGALLVVGGAASGRTSLAELLAGQLGTSVVDREDALWDALHEPGPLVVDDLDLQLARLSDEQQSSVAQTLARRMREGSPVALTARRVSTAMGQIAPLAELRILLRIASRQEHIVAGGAGHLHDGALPPGAGWLDDERIQLALPEGPAARRAPRAVPLPEGPIAAVLGPGAQLPAALAALDLAARSAKPGQGAAGGDAAGPATGAAPELVLGSVGEWEAAWGELDRLRAERPVLVLGVDERQLRQVLRHAPPPPPMRSAPAWVLDGGRFERLRYPSSEASGVA
ncbi:DNA segregation ATPase FtsK/SpoIIIE, S-DNA-T family [Agrococcus baldri]|uniref:DNA segregation ATPase FtsK/SpoIIIE, S-DNA-T family n=1 Tax=Agrococcus baldri TaxID=153730 RepID=A0AA94KYF3_9MICO|nr:FtsK/SpoIIIE domain-containing protein [Agrococcus baldri]SFR98027.1 DNA segregation ATPase FtsK/SpoIIIE, S-DNA-T family [Agrococcus baldri]